LKGWTAYPEGTCKLVQRGVDEIACVLKWWWIVEVDKL